MNRNPLYLEKGYLNQDHIRKIADRFGINFIVEIGARQVGKTYGVLEMMLREKRQFILMRRTITETDFICNGINNPFVVHKDFSVIVKKDTKYTGAIMVDEEYRGAVMALSAVAKVRGFAGELYSDLVFDEFIPESHVTRIKNEGDAFLNAVVTISGNRELNDQPPLRVWLLANANNINSPILDVLGLTDKVERMRASGQELSVLEERGILLILPRSDQLVEQRRQTALFKAIDRNSEFSKMALDNEFSYNDASNIKSFALREFLPVFQIGDMIYYRHKSKRLYYVTTTSTVKCSFYDDTERERKRLLHEQPNIKRRYIAGQTWFKSLAIKEKFINLLNS